MLIDLIRTSLLPGLIKKTDKKLKLTTRQMSLCKPLGILIVLLVKRFSAKKLKKGLEFDKKLFEL